MGDNLKANWTGSVLRLLFFCKLAKPSYSQLLVTHGHPVVSRWSAAPPRSFCPSCSGLEVTYKSTVDPRGASKTADGFNYNSNSPLVGSVAAGSAFLGELVVLPFFDAQYLKSLEEI